MAQLNNISFSEIGYGNLAQTNRILSMVGPDSAPIKRIIQDARNQGLLIDATAGKKTRTVLIMDTEQVILSAWDAKKILAKQVYPDFKLEEE